MANRCPGTGIMVGEFGDADLKGGLKTGRSWEAVAKALGDSGSVVLGEREHIIGIEFDPLFGLTLTIGRM